MGSISLYRNNGDGTFTKITTGAVVTDGGDSVGCTWGDFDNDGFLDLFVANRGGNNFLYRNNGDGTFTKITTGSVASEGGHSWGAAWGDYDNDGFLDLFVANRDGQNNFLYRNNGNANHWIKIKCVGTRSNRSAIGAKVRLKASIGGVERWQLREIGGGNGGIAQNSLDAHFGLGNATNAEVLRIEWPSGIVQEMRGLSANQFLTVTEPPVLKVGQGLTPAGFELVLVSRGGFTYDIDASTDLAKWSFVTSLQRVNGSVQVLDPAAKGLEHRFYRAIQRQ
jgi:hypothetical protein